MGEKLKQFVQKNKSTEGTPKKTALLESPPEDKKNAKKEALKASRTNGWIQKIKDNKIREDQKIAAKSKEQFEAEQAKDKAEMEAQKKAEAERIAAEEAKRKELEEAEKRRKDAEAKKKR